jgi:TetR/AcrR family transcriptional regulator, transcriptional repressor for nem operon
MTGVKQFDQSVVLDRAVMLFWSRGYEATSIGDLVEAIGINRGSLYATFGNKRRFFLTALDRYIRTIGATLFAELEGDDPRRALEHMFAAIIERTSDSRFPRGCLVTNTSLECPSSGDEISRKVTELIAAQESAIYQVLRRAQAGGSLDSKQNAQALARLFLAVAQGMNVAHKAGATPAVLRDMADTAMSIWRRPSGRKN